MTMKRVFQQLEKQHQDKQPHSSSQIGRDKLKTIKSQWQKQLQQSQNEYQDLEIQIQLLRKKQQRCLTNQTSLKEIISKVEKDIDLMDSQLQNL